MLTYLCCGRQTCHLWPLVPLTALQCCRVCQMQHLPSDSAFGTLYGDGSERPRSRRAYQPPWTGECISVARRSVSSAVRRPLVRPVDSRIVQRCPLPARPFRCRSRLQGTSAGRLPSAPVELRLHSAFASLITAAVIESGE